MIKVSFTGYIGRGGARIIEGKNGNGNFLSMDVGTEIFSHGEKKTMWIRVYSREPKHLGKLAQCLTQGKAIEVAGEQQEPREWEDKDGNKHVQVVIVAKTIDFLPYGGKKREDKDEKQPQNSQAVPSPAVVDSTPFPAPEEKTDDLPF